MGTSALASPFLTKRRAGWYLRIRVPADLVPIFGTHLTKSLSTRDHSIARQRAVTAVARLFDHWEDVRQTMAARWKGKEIGELMPADMIGADGKEIERFEAGLTQGDRARFRQRLSLLVHVEQNALIEKQADISVIKTYVQNVQVSRLRGEIEGLKGAVAVLAGSIRPNPVPVTPAEPPRENSAAALPVSDPRGRQPWMDFINDFFADRESIGASSEQSHRQAFRELEGVAGRKPLADLTKADIKSFANYLRDKPIKRAGRTRMSRDTIIKMLSHVRSYLAWTVESGIIRENPGEGVQARSQTREERDGEGSRQAFSREQLDLLFNSPIYTGCESVRRRSRPGAVILRDERYWFFLTVLLSGARIDELAEAPAKLFDLEGIVCLNLLDVEGKTNNAPRLIPILPELKRLGFLEFAKSKENHGKLFKGGNSFTDWSKGTNRYLRDIGIKDPEIVTYSLRHNFRQMLNASEVLGISLETGDKIFGHGKKSARTVGGNYGRKLSGAEAKLIVEKVKSPIDLSHLYPLPRLNRS